MPLHVFGAHGRSRTGLQQICSLLHNRPGPCAFRYCYFFSKKCQFFWPLWPQKLFHHTFRIENMLRSGYCSTSHFSKMACYLLPSAYYHHIDGKFYSSASAVPPWDYILANITFTMAGERRVEHPTRGFGDRCSTN